VSDTLGRRLISASAVLTLLVALIFGAMLFAIRDLRDAGRQERRSEQVIAASGAMQTLVLNLETSVRGYVITREEPFLDPWKRNLAGFPASAAHFDRLVADKPQERQIERSIVAEIRSYIDNYSKNLVATARHDPRAALAIVSSGAGKRRVDALRAQFGTLVATETATAAHEREQADAAGSWATRAGIAGVIGSVLLILGFAVYLARAIIIPLRRLASERAAYEISLREPEGGRTASLERQNTALELQSDGLKAHQVTMEAHQVTMEAHQVTLERLVDINRALLDASVDGIRLVDLEGRTLLANSVIEHLTTEIFKIPKYATMQEGSAIADRLTDPVAYLATMETIAADPDCATRDDFELADVRRAFERHTGPVRDSAGELIGRIIVVREITAERDAARLKSELVATVSHELRTPLTGVLGFAELLMHHDLDDDTGRRYLQTIHSEAQRLTALVDDFLDVQKIEAGRFTLALESFELAALLEHEVEIFAAQATNHQLEFETPNEPLAMVGDRNRIGQVIANLLSNAIKYSPAGGAVTITATPREGFARVTVSDAGLGIPADQQAQVFTRFFRVDSSDTREIGGTGLGLALCHEIVTAHGGRIGFESTEGVGSTFWFELPSAWRASAADNRARVLVVEDDPALATLLGECLALDGLEVELAATGESGLERALARPPAVVCLDVFLPGALDGWQVLVQLKANPLTAHVPVIVCTGEKGRSTAATLGATEFVAKPFTGDQLREAVARQLSAERSSVLVCDDDLALRRLVVETLARDGGELREAADGLEALAMIAVRAPDVLVMDLAMPKLDGFGVLERLLERAETRQIPVVVLTARELTGAERRLLRERNASVLEKRKYSGDQLRWLVRQALGQSAEPAPVSTRAA
jgi:signal transduction histidine kinase/CheY-like chemotaxis protein/CHASE3 domain sensor protein